MKKILWFVLVVMVLVLICSCQIGKISIEKSIVFEDAGFRLMKEKNLHYNKMHVETERNWKENFFVEIDSVMISKKYRHCNLENTCIIFDKYLLVDSYIDSYVYYEPFFDCFDAKGKKYRIKGHLEKILDNHLRVHREYSNLGSYYVVFNNNLEIVKYLRSDIQNNIQSCVKYFSEYSSLNDLGNNLILASPVGIGKYFFMSSDNYQHVNTNMYDNTKPFGNNYLTIKRIKSYLTNTRSLNGKITNKRLGVALLGLIPVIGGSVGSSNITAEQIQELNYKFRIGFEVSSQTGQETGKRFIIHQETGEIEEV